MEVIGSSPLARGLLYPYTRPFPFYRIIPARAGFTHILETFSVPLWDHPRSRGVYSSLSSLLCSHRDHPRSRGVYRR